MFYTSASDSIETANFCALLFVEVAWNNAKYCKDSIFALAAKYRFSPHDVLTSSVTCVKQRFWNYFSDLL